MLSATRAWCRPSARPPTPTAVVLPGQSIGSIPTRTACRRDVIGTILDAPGYARGTPTARCAATPSCCSSRLRVRAIASGGYAARIRGMRAPGAAIRPGFRMVPGPDAFRVRPSGTHRRCRHAARIRPEHWRRGAASGSGPGPSSAVSAADGVNANEVIGRCRDARGRDAHAPDTGSVQGAAGGLRRWNSVELPRMAASTNPALAVTAETQQSRFDRIVAGRIRRTSRRWRT